MSICFMVAGAKPALELSPVQQEAASQISAKIASAAYHLIENACLCGSMLGEIIAGQDRYGILIPQVFCASCGIVRSAAVFDDAATVDFYGVHYRSLYTGAEIPEERFFADQRARGNQLLKCFQAEAIVSSDISVVEIGCGAGGILAAFQSAGYHCKGFDYDERYLSYGRSLGLNLVWGDYRDGVSVGAADVIILSHVLEHFVRPLAELVSVVSRLGDNGYLVVEVPGLLSIHRAYQNPCIYFQSAHVFNFSAAHLSCIFRSLGLEPVYSDEKCVFIGRKPVGWTAPVPAPSLPKLAELGVSKAVRKYLWWINLANKLGYFLLRAKARSMANRSS